MELENGYKQTEIGVIPSDWKVDIVKNIAQIKTGSKNTQDRIENGFYPFYVRSQTIERINSYSYDGEAILTAGDGVGVGKVIHYVNEKFDCHQRVYRISDFISNVNGYYFYLYFSNNFYNRMMQMTAKSSVDSVRMEMIADMLIPLPPTINEQTAIATALSDTDTWINSLEQLLIKKRQIKQGAMQELLQPKEGWEMKKLGEIGDCIIGLTYSPNNVSDEGTLVLRSSNVSGNKLVYENTVFVDLEVSEKLTARKGDILICVRNGSRNLIGKCAYIDGRGIGESFGAFMSVFRSNYNDYIFHVFQSNIIKKQIEEHLGATINQITNKSLNSFEIPFPPKQEQTRIAKILSDMDTEITELETKLDKAKHLKQGMMQELLTGRIRLV